MSREHRRYPSPSPSGTPSRPPRAESRRPDRPYGNGRGDPGDYGDHESRYDDAPRARRYAGSYASSRSERTQVLDEGPYEAPYEEDNLDDDDEIYEYYEPIDRRWVWVAGVAAAILLIAVICTVVILGGGDSGSVSATVNPPAATSQPAATRTSSAPPPATSPAPVPPAAALPAETVTTLAPTPSATLAPPPPVAAAPASNTVTYTVSGTRSLIDLVTVIYTDAQGALQTDLNVALPWRKTVALDPGVTLSSVTATSITGQLNCSITDGSGAAIAAQNGNSIITTCTR